MFEPIKVGPIPSHVQILEKLADAENFARDPNLIAGRVNLALHQAQMPQELIDAVSLLTIKAMLILRAGTHNRTSFSVFHWFKLNDLNKKSDLDLARNWLRAVNKSGMGFTEEHLMPLAKDVVAQMKTFALTWTDKTVEAELPTDGDGLTRLQHHLTRKYVTPTESIATIFSVRDHNFLSPDIPHFTSPYDSNGKHEIFGEVNYAGHGMIWFDNNNVLRLPRHDRGSPQRAQILNMQRYYELQPGQTAYHTGNREDGLAIYPAAPREPESQPSVYLQMHRHIRRPS